MEDDFYQRYTGKLHSTTSRSYYSNASNRSCRNTSVFSQYPLETLTDTQLELSGTFLAAMTGKESLHIDRETRAYYIVGSWIGSKRECFTACCIRQPNVSNFMVHLSGVKAQDLLPYLPDFEKT